MADETPDSGAPSPDIQVTVGGDFSPFFEQIAQIGQSLSVEATAKLDLDASGIRAILSPAMNEIRREISALVKSPGSFTKTGRATPGVMQGFNEIVSKYAGPHLDLGDSGEVLLTEYNKKIVKTVKDWASADLVHVMRQFNLSVASLDALGGPELQMQAAWRKALVTVSKVSGQTADDLMAIQESREQLQVEMTRAATKMHSGLWAASPQTSAGAADVRESALQAVQFLKDRPEMLEVATKAIEAADLAVNEQLAKRAKKARRALLSGSSAEGRFRNTVEDALNARDEAKKSGRAEDEAEGLLLFREKIRTASKKLHSELYAAHDGLPPAKLQYANEQATAVLQQVLGEGEDFNAAMDGIQASRDRILDLSARQMKDTLRDNRRMSSMALSDLEAPTGGYRALVAAAKAGNREEQMVAVDRIIQEGIYRGDSRPEIENNIRRSVGSVQDAYGDKVNLGDVTPASVFAPKKEKAYRKKLAATVRADAKAVSAEVLAQLAELESTPGEVARHINQFMEDATVHVRRLPQSLRASWLKEFRRAFKTPGSAALERFVSAGSDVPFNEEQKTFLGAEVSSTVRATLGPAMRQVNRSHGSQDVKYFMGDLRARESAFLKGLGDKTPHGAGAMKEAANLGSDEGIRLAGRLVAKEAVYSGADVPEATEAVKKAMREAGVEKMPGGLFRVVNQENLGAWRSAIVKRAVEHASAAAKEMVNAFSQLRGTQAEVVGEIDRRLRSAMVAIDSLTVPEARAAAVESFKTKIRQPSAMGVLEDMVDSMKEKKLDESGLSDQSKGLLGQAIAQANDRVASGAGSARMTSTQITQKKQKALATYDTMAGKPATEKLRAVMADLGITESDHGPEGFAVRVEAVKKSLRDVGREVVHQGVARPPLVDRGARHKQGDIIYPATKSDVVRTVKAEAVKYGIPAGYASELAQSVFESEKKKVAPTEKTRRTLSAIRAEHSERMKVNEEARESYPQTIAAYHTPVLKAAASRMHKLDWNAPKTKEHAESAEAYAAAVKALEHDIADIGGKERQGDKVRLFDSILREVTGDPKLKSVGRDYKFADRDRPKNFQPGVGAVNMLTGSVPEIAAMLPKGSVKDAAEAVRVAEAAKILFQRLGFGGTMLERGFHLRQGELAQSPEGWLFDDQLLNAVSGMQPKMDVAQAMNSLGVWQVVQKTKDASGKDVLSRLQQFPLTQKAEAEALAKQTADAVVEWSSRAKGGLPRDLVELSGIASSPESPLVNRGAKDKVTRDELVEFVKKNSPVAGMSLRTIGKYVTFQEAAADREATYKKALEAGTISQKDYDQATDMSLLASQKSVRSHRDEMQRELDKSEGSPYESYFMPGHVEGTYATTVLQKPVPTDKAVSAESVKLVEALRSRMPVDIEASRTRGRKVFESLPDLKGFFDEEMMEYLERNVPSFDQPAAFRDPATHFRVHEALGGAAFGDVSEWEGVSPAIAGRVRRLVEGHADAKEYLMASGGALISLPDLDEYIDDPRASMDEFGPFGRIISPEERMALEDVRKSPTRRLRAHGDFSKREIYGQEGLYRIRHAMREVSIESPDMKAYLATLPKEERLRLIKKAKENRDKKWAETGEYANFSFLNLFHAGELQHHPDSGKLPDWADKKKASVLSKMFMQVAGASGADLAIYDSGEVQRKRYPGNQSGGLAEFYDKTEFNLISKEAAKRGVKLSTMHLPVYDENDNDIGGKVHVMPITPEMRQQKDMGTFFQGGEQEPLASWSGWFRAMSGSADYSDLAQPGATPEEEQARQKKIAEAVLASGHSVVRFMRGANPSSFVHEGMHQLRHLWMNPDIVRAMPEHMRRGVTPDQAAELQKKYGMTREGEELLARQGEAYFGWQREFSPDVDPQLQTMFKVFSESMRSVYKDVANSPLTQEVAPEVESALNQIFGLKKGDVKNVSKMATAMAQQSPSITPQAVAQAHAGLGSGAPPPAPESPGVLARRMVAMASSPLQGRDALVASYGDRVRRAIEDASIATEIFNQKYASSEDDRNLPYGDPRRQRADRRVSAARKQMQRYRTPVEAALQAADLDGVGPLEVADYLQGVGELGMRVADDDRVLQLSEAGVLGEVVKQLLDGKKAGDVAASVSYPKEYIRSARVLLASLGPGVLRPGSPVAPPPETAEIAQKEPELQELVSRQQAATGAGAPPTVPPQAPPAATPGDEDDFEKRVRHAIDVPSVEYHARSITEAAVPGSRKTKDPVAELKKRFTDTKLRRDFRTAVQSGDPGDPAFERAKEVFDAAYADLDASIKALPPEMDDQAKQKLRNELSMNLAKASAGHVLPEQAIDPQSRQLLAQGAFRHVTGNLTGRKLSAKDIVGAMRDVVEALEQIEKGADAQLVASRNKLQKIANALSIAERYAQEGGQQPRDVAMVQSIKDKLADQQKIVDRESEFDAQHKIELARGRDRLTEAQKQEKIVSEMDTRILADHDTGRPTPARFIRKRDAAMNKLQAMQASDPFQGYHAAKDWDYALLQASYGLQDFFQVLAQPGMGVTRAFLAMANNLGPALMSLGLPLATSTAAIGGLLAGTTLLNFALGEEKDKFEGLKEKVDDAAKSYNNLFEKMYRLRSGMGAVGASPGRGFSELQRQMLEVPLMADPMHNTLKTFRNQYEQQRLQGTIEKTPGFFSKTLTDIGSAIWKLHIAPIYGLFDRVGTQVDFQNRGAKESLFPRVPESRYQFERSIKSPRMRQAFGIENYPADRREALDIPGGAASREPIDYLGMIFNATPTLGHLYQASKRQRKNDAYNEVAGRIRAEREEMEKSGYLQQQADRINESSERIAALKIMSQETAKMPSRAVRDYAEAGRMESSLSITGIQDDYVKATIAQQKSDYEMLVQARNKEEQDRAITLEQMKQPQAHLERLSLIKEVAIRGRLEGVGSLSAGDRQKFEEFRAMGNTAARGINTGEFDEAALLELENEINNAKMALQPFQLELQEAAARTQVFADRLEASKKVAEAVSREAGGGLRVLMSRFASLDVGGMFAAVGRQREAAEAEELMDRLFDGMDRFSKEAMRARNEVLQFGEEFAQQMARVKDITSGLRVFVATNRGPDAEEKNVAAAVTTGISIARALSFDISLPDHEMAILARRSAELRHEFSELIKQFPGAADGLQRLKDLMESNFKMQAIRQLENDPGFQALRGAGQEMGVGAFLLPERAKATQDMMVKNLRDANGKPVFNAQDAMFLAVQSELGKMGLNAVPTGAVLSDINDSEVKLMQHLDSVIADLKKQPQDANTQAKIDQAERMKPLVQAGFLEKRQRAIESDPIFRSLQAVNPLATGIVSLSSVMDQARKNAEGLRDGVSGDEAAIVSMYETLARLGFTTQEAAAKMRELDVAEKTRVAELEAQKANTNDPETLRLIDRQQSLIRADAAGKRAGIFADSPAERARRGARGGYVDSQAYNIDGRRVSGRRLNFEARLEEMREELGRNLAAVPKEDTQTRKDIQAAHDKAVIREMESYAGRGQGRATMIDSASLWTRIQESLTDDPALKVEQDMLEELKGIRADLKAGREPSGTVFNEARGPINPEEKVDRKAGPGEKAKPNAEAPAVKAGQKVDEAQKGQEEQRKKAEEAVRKNNEQKQVNAIKAETHRALVLGGVSKEDADAIVEDAFDGVTDPQKAMEASKKAGETGVLQSERAGAGEVVRGALPKSIPGVSDAEKLSGLGSQRTFDAETGIADEKRNKAFLDAAGALFDEEKHSKFVALHDRQKDFDQRVDDAVVREEELKKQLASAMDERKKATLPSTIGIANAKVHQITGELAEATEQRKLAVVSAREHKANVEEASPVFDPKIFNEASSGEREGNPDAQMKVIRERIEKELETGNYTDAQKEQAQGILGRLESGLAEANISAAESVKKATGHGNRAEDEVVKKRLAVRPFTREEEEKHGGPGRFVVDPGIGNRGYFGGWNDVTEDALKDEFLQEQGDSVLEFYANEQGVPQSVIDSKKGHPYETRLRAYEQWIEENKKKPEDNKPPLEGPGAADAGPSRIDLTPSDESPAGDSESPAEALLSQVFAVSPVSSTMRSGEASSTGFSTVSNRFGQNSASTLSSGGSGVQSANVERLTANGNVLLSRLVDHAKEQVSELIAMKQELSAQIARTGVTSNA